MVDTLELQRLAETLPESLIFENLDLSKAQDVPSEGASNEEKRAAQKRRAKKFGIEALEEKGERLTFPKGWPRKLNDYGDSVNLKFRIDDKAHARNARVRFKQFAKTYSKKKSKRIVHTRIVERELKFGIKVRIDDNDPLDQLLPASLRERARRESKRNYGMDIDKDFKRKKTGLGGDPEHFHYAIYDIETGQGRTSTKGQHKHEISKFLIQIENGHTHKLDAKVAGHFEDGIRFECEASVFHKKDAADHADYQEAVELLKSEFIRENSNATEEEIDNHIEDLKGFIHQGYAATGDEDITGDTILPQALRKGAKDLMQYSTVLFNHDQDEPIGRNLVSKFRDNAIKVTFVISQTCPDKNAQIVDGTLSKMSIRGWIIDFEEKEEEDEDAPDPRRSQSGWCTRPAMRIKDIRLVEESVVSIPANPEAVIVKTLDQAISMSLDKSFRLNSEDERRAISMSKEFEKDEPIVESSQEEKEEIEAPDAEKEIVEVKVDEKIDGLADAVKTLVDVQAPLLEGFAKMQKDIADIQAKQEKSQDDKDDDSKDSVAKILESVKTTQDKMADALNTQTEILANNVSLRKGVTVGNEEEKDNRSLKQKLADACVKAEKSGVKRERIAAAVLETIHNTPGLDRGWIRQTMPLPDSHYERREMARQAIVNKTKRLTEDEFNE